MSSEKPLLTVPGVRLLAEFLRDNGMTLETFGAEVGVSEVTVHRWAKGKARPSYEKACDIARATGGKIGVDSFYPAAEVAA